MTVYVAAKAYAEKLREAVAITFLALEGQFVLTGQLSGSGPNAALLQTCACCPSLHAAAKDALHHAASAVLPSHFAIKKHAS